MKRTVPKTVLAGLAIAVAFESTLAIGCKNSDSITGIARPTPTAVPTLDINGAWAGTVSYYYADDWFPCDRPSQNSAAATFSQNGSAVTGTIASCNWRAEFQGVLPESRLTGTMTLTWGDLRFTGALS